MRRWTGSLLTALVIAASAFAAGDEPPVPMSTYVFGILRRGPLWTAQRTPAADSLQAGHMANIQRMADEGALVGAGPFGGGGELRGLFIFRADSVAQVRPMAERDPAIRAGRLALDLYTWYAPAGIGEPYRRMAKTPGFRDSMITLQVGFLRKGPKWTPNSTPETQALQREHVARNFRMLLSGELGAAGPLDGAGDLRGVSIFRGDSATARRLADADPTVRTGRLVIDLRPWWCAWGVMPGDTL